MSSPTPRLRHELKLRLPVRHFAGLKACLQRKMQPDPHNQARGYRIRSLYFDSPEYHFYYQKLDGHPQRVKPRLRFYDAAWEQTFAELKIKVGQRGYKIRHGCPFQRQYLEPAGLTSFLRSHMTLLGAFGQTIVTHGLVAACWINYRRHAFMQRTFGLRVTMDFDLRVAHARRPERELAFFPRQYFILEIKYADRYPNWLRQTIQRLEEVPLALSKYCMGLNALLGVHHYA